MQNEPEAPKAAPQGLPRARPLSRRSAWLPWVVPTLALLLVAFLWWETREESGLALEIEAPHGHGIEAGDAVRYRGTTVGEVRQVELLPSLAGVLLRVELDPRASSLARAGTRFWIVRPHLSLDEVSGLETLLGARYLAVLPGPVDAPVQARFHALDEPPVRTELAPGGLEFQLEAPERYGILAGAPIQYRGIQVGTILSVGLASDSRVVVMRAYVEPEYGALVRSSSRFWKLGGVELDVSLTGGFQMGVGSLRSMLVGGVAFSTPEEGGERVRTGQRFRLAAKPEEAWLAWQPRLPVGEALLPSGSALPEMLRVTRRTKGGLLRLGRDRSESAWALVLEDGLVGPRAVLLAPDGESDSSLELLGQQAEVEQTLAQAAELARVALRAPLLAGWPRSRARARLAGEELLVLGDPAGDPVPLDGDQVDMEGRLEEAKSFDESWSGAAVLARSDGALVGLIVLENGRARVAPIP